MRIDDPFRPEAMAGPDREDVGPLLRYVSIELLDPAHYFQAEARRDALEYNAIAVACNGYALAVVPIRLTSDDAPGIVDAEMLGAARRYLSAAGPGARPPGLSGIMGDLLPASLLAGGASFPRLGPAGPRKAGLAHDAGWIGWRGTVRAFLDQERQGAGRQMPGARAFSVNPALLGRLTEALGVEYVKLTHTGRPNDPLLVEPLYTGRALGTWPRPPFGLVMPMASHAGRDVTRLPDLGAGDRPPVVGTIPTVWPTEDAAPASPASPAAANGKPAASTVPEGSHGSGDGPWQASGVGV